MGFVSSGWCIRPGSYTLWRPIKCCLFARCLSDSSLTYTNRFTNSFVNVMQMMMDYIAFLYRPVQKHYTRSCVLFFCLFSGPMFSSCFICRDWCMRDGLDLDPVPLVQPIMAVTILLCLYFHKRPHVQGQR